MDDDSVFDADDKDNEEEDALGLIEFLLNWLPLCTLPAAFEVGTSGMTKLAE